MTALDTWREKQLDEWHEKRRALILARASAPFGRHHPRDRPRLLLGAVIPGRPYYRFWQAILGLGTQPFTRKDLITAMGGSTLRLSQFLYELKAARTLKVVGVRREEQYNRLGGFLYLNLHKPRSPARALAALEARYRDRKSHLARHPAHLRWEVRNRQTLAALRQTLNNPRLTDRERLVAQGRTTGRTLAEIGHDLGLTRERVRKIEQYLVLGTCAADFKATRLRRSRRQPGHHENLQDQNVQ